MMNTYQTGSLITVSNTDYSSAGFIETSTLLPADPAVVTLSVIISGVEQTPSTYVSGSTTGPYTIVKDGVGLYSAELDTTGQPGEWIYRWSGTGGGPQAIKSNTFTVTDYPQP